MPTGPENGPPVILATTRGQPLVRLRCSAPPRRPAPKPPPIGALHAASVGEDPHTP
ncbi:hypothetical protein [Hymenobacter wooponensis]|uniref:hypothetical protein n=1 Tax=Hymenobacter wooponensis TaxID=1525360 RepID=UPI00143683DE|nr:hypothetical protein [Hymenobacter wooponensis]